MTDIESRLQNWARWVRVGFHYQSCRSLESKYKSPQTWHPQEPKTFTDIIDAQRVEAAITSDRCKYKHRELIKYAYITPYINHNKICRKLRIRNNDLDAEIRTAVNNLSTLLT